MLRNARISHNWNEEAGFSNGRLTLEHQVDTIELLGRYATILAHPVRLDIASGMQSLSDPAGFYHDRNSMGVGDGGTPRVESHWLRMRR